MLFGSVRLPTARSERKASRPTLPFPKGKSKLYDLPACQQTNEVGRAKTRPCWFNEQRMDCSIQRTGTDQDTVLLLSHCFPSQIVTKIRISCLKVHMHECLKTLKQLHLFKMYSDINKIKFLRGYSEYQ